MNKLKKIISDVLGIGEEEITDKLGPDDVDSWDSFNGLMLVSELENIFKVKFSVEEVVSVKCVKDIKDALLKHGVNLED